MAAVASEGDRPSGFGPGKVILLGEHAVVYGQPAVAGPLTLGVSAFTSPSQAPALALPKGLSKADRERLTAAFNRAAELCGAPKVRLRLESDLPISVGLGSSAAVGVACARALLRAAGRAPEPREVAKIALRMEEEFHGTPSGVDHTTSALGQLIAYRRRPGAKLGQATVLVCPVPLHVIVALAGKRRPTRETVGGLRQRREQWPRRYERLFDEIGQAAKEGAQAITEGDLEALGDAMNVNHGLLSALQLSSRTLDEVVHTLREHGALGAKLTGAGGDGGAVVGLFRDPRPALARLRRTGVPCFHSQLAGPRSS